MLFAADNTAAMGSMLFFAALYIGLIVLMIASLWVLFTKAGQPGWAAIIPIYNTYVLICEVGKMEIVWFILSFVPCVNFVALFMASMKVAEKFGKDSAYGIGLFFLPFIFYPILAFGSAEYEGGPKRRKRRTRDEDDYEEEEGDDRRKW